MIGAIIAKKKARSGFDALNRRDLDAFLANWGEAATYIYPGNLSVSGEFEGKEAIKEWCQKFMEQFPQVIFDIKNICVQKIFSIDFSTNVVTVEWDGSFTNNDGKEFKNSGVTVINIKKGKVVLVRQYIFDAETAKIAWGEA